MKKGFSLLNIIILISVFSLAFIFYGNLKRSEFLVADATQNNNQELINTLDNALSQKQEKVADNITNEVVQQKTVSALPDPSTLPNSTKIIESPSVSSIEKASENPGYFINEKYNYKITFPKDWNLKKDYLEEITIGTIPPKNGQGAVKIKIGENSESEVKKLEQEVKKYSEIMELRKEKIIIDETEADKLTVINNINGIKVIYIFFTKSNIDYMISYSYESDNFAREADKVINDFKFISK